MKNNREEDLVECPHADGAHYFKRHCMAEKKLGVVPCVTCEAMENPKTLQETMDEYSRS